MRERPEPKQTAKALDAENKDIIKQDMLSESHETCCGFLDEEFTVVKERDHCSGRRTSSYAHKYHVCV